jgi:hypothetical protein
VDVWRFLTPYHLYAVGSPGTVPADNALAPSPGIARSAGPSAHDGYEAPPWNPANPLFWFGAVLALTLGGIAAASTSVRVGPVRASVSAGRK